MSNTNHVCRFDRTSSWVEFCMDCGLIISRYQSSDDEDEEYDYGEDYETINERRREWELHKQIAELWPQSELKKLYECETAIAAMCMATKDHAILSALTFIYPKPFEDRLKQLTDRRCHIVAQAPYGVQMELPKDIPISDRRRTFTMYDVHAYWHAGPFSPHMSINSTPYFPGLPTPSQNVPDSWENL